VPAGETFDVVDEKDAVTGQLSRHEVHRQKRLHRAVHIFVFNRCGDRLFVRYIRPYIEAARRHEDAPRPSDRARAAMDRVDAMCADPQYHVAMMLEPGDMQFVNNYHVLHARESYTDDRAAGRIRHLKRLWLETDVLADAEKPERFRLGRTDAYWSRHGRTKSELTI